MITYLTTEQAAAKLQICIKAFRRLGIPRVEIAPRTFRYRKEDIDAFARSRLQYGLMDTPRQGRTGNRMRQRSVIKNRGVPKVFTPADLSKIAVRGGEG